MLQSDRQSFINNALILIILLKCFLWCVRVCVGLYVPPALNGSGTVHWEKINKDHKGSGSW